MAAGRISSGGLLDENEVGGIVGHVHLPHAPDMVAVGGELGYPVLHCGAFPVTALVTGVDGYRHDDSRCQDIQGLLEPRQGRVGPCNNITVATRQVTEVEYHRFDRPAAVLFDECMAGMDDCDIFDAACVGKSRGGCCNSLFLYVEGPYPAARAYQFSE